MLRAISSTSRASATCAATSGRTRPRLPPPHRQPRTSHTRWLHRTQSQRVIYRRAGEDGSLPKKRGGPPVDRGDFTPRSELEALRVGERTTSRRSRVSGKIVGLEVQERGAKIRAVDDLKTQFPLALLLSIAHLPRSAFYDHRNRLCHADRDGRARRSRS